MKRSAKTQHVPRVVLVVERPESGTEWFTESGAYCKRNHRRPLGEAWTGPICACGPLQCRVERPESGVGDREQLRAQVDVDKRPRYAPFLAWAQFDGSADSDWTISRGVARELADDLAAKDKLLTDALGYPEWVARAERAEAALAAAAPPSDARFVDSLISENEWVWGQVSYLLGILRAIDRAADAPDLTFFREISRGAILKIMSEREFGEEHGRPVTRIPYPRLDEDSPLPGELKRWLEGE